MNSFTGKVAVVTGAANGIGFGLARKMLEEGASVVATDVNEGELAAAVESLREFGNVSSDVVDVSDSDAMDALAARVNAEFGGVHLLFNNAGVGGYQRFDTISAEAWRWILGVDLFGIVNGIRSFLPYLAEQVEAHIVNTGAVAGFMHSKYLSAYVTAKAGVVGLTESLHAEFAEEHPNVGISVVSPGAVDTDISKGDRNAPAGVKGFDEADPALREFRAMRAQSKKGAMTTAQLAQIVVDGIRAKQVHIFTHPEHAQRYEKRAAGIIASWQQAGAGVA